MFPAHSDYAAMHLGTCREIFSSSLRFCCSAFRHLPVKFPASLAFACASTEALSEHVWQWPARCLRWLVW
eukprot:2241815-Amphidinium_carterae.1